MRSLNILYHIFDRYLLGKAKKATIKIPKMIGEYYVVETLLSEEYSDTAVLKIKDSKGQLFVAKYWQGTKRNYSFDSLKREYQIYKILERIYYSDHFKRKKYCVKLPRVVHFFEGGQESYLILSFVRGRILESCDSKTVLKGLKEVNSFLKDVGEYTSQDEKKLLGKKSYWYHLLLYPLFFVKSFVSNPKQLKPVLAGLFKYLVLTTSQKQKNILVHGDLNLKNIIVSSQCFYPIDFEFIRYEPLEYGIANTLRYVWSNKKNRNLYTNYIKKEIKHNRINSKLLASLITIHGTQGLMATNFSQKEIVSIADYLENAPFEFFGLNHRIRSLCYRLVYLLNYLPIFKKGPVVLCYHSFAGNSDRYSIFVKEFEKQMEIVSKNDGFISAKDIGNKKLKKGVLVTIDDGFKSVLKISAVVKRLKIPVLLFVLSNPEKANRKELNTNEKLLTWSDIRALKKAGWEIGSHSATHANFENLNKQGLKKEIDETKASIEKKLKNKVSYFAYPKGAFNKKSVDAVKINGFKYGFSVLPGNIHDQKNKYILPRTIVDSTHNSHDFPYLYSNAWFLVRKITAPLKIWEKIS